MSMLLCTVLGLLLGRYLVSLCATRWHFKTDGALHLKQHFDEASEFN